MSLRIIVLAAAASGLLTPAPVASRQSGRATTFEAEAQARIQELSARLRVREADAADSDRYQRVRDDATGQLLREVDDVVEAAANAGQEPAEIQTRLRTLLPEADPESSGPAVVRGEELRGGRALVAAFTIVRGAHDDLPTIRGYRSVARRFGLVATAGEDFDGFGMFAREVRSPTQGELWLLAWGPAHTFNGRKVRLRLYAFDGRSFATRWTPDDMFDVTVQILSSGFAVDHVVRGTVPWSNVRDEYVLTAKGPVKTTSR